MYQYQSLSGLADLEDRGERVNVCALEQTVRALTLVAELFWEG